MNIKKEVLSTLSIEKIFPQSIDDWNTIFVNFSTITMANTVTSYVRNMRSEVQVDIYVPKEWRTRYKALGKIAYDQRYPPQGEVKYKTRIRWGNTDLCILRKAPDVRYWSAMDITTPLPPVDLCAVELPNHSPAPGRENRDKRPRSSGSDTDTSIAMNIRTDETTSIEDSPNLQSSGNMGTVIEEESYCPSSPAPSNRNTAFPYNSPIFTKKNVQSYRVNPLIN